MKNVLLVAPDRRRAEGEIARHHGRVTQVLGQGLLVARVPDGLDPGALQASREVDDTALAGLGAVEQRFAQAFPRLRGEETRGLRAARRSAPLEQPGLPGAHGHAAPAPGRGRPPDSPGPHGYLVGSVSVAVVIVSGPTPDLQFSADDVRLVTSQVLEGLDFLVGAQPTAGIVFQTQQYPVSLTTPAVPTCTQGCTAGSYGACEEVWLGPTLAALGYPPGRTGITDFVNHLQEQEGTDWAYAAIFVKYPVCHYAYAAAGGPMTVIQFANDGWGPKNLHRTFAHETCHVFNALDEYKETCTCGRPSGYFQAPNDNCANCSGKHLPCLMDHNDLRLCYWSRRQLGWSAFGPPVNVSLLNDAKSTLGPALAAWNDLVYMAFRDSETSSLWLCDFDGDTWSTPSKITDQNGAKTFNTPALAGFGSLLCMAYRGSQSSTLYACTFDGTSWSAQTNVTALNGAKLSTAPAICEYAGTLYLFFRGNLSSSLNMCSFDGTSWSAQTSVTALNGAKLDASPALAVYNDLLWVAYLGDGGKKLYAFSFDGTTFSAQTCITDVNGAESELTPALAAFDGFLYLLYKGQHWSDMWSCAFDGSTWLEQWKVTDQNGAELHHAPALAPLSNDATSTLVAAYGGIPKPTLWSFQIERGAPPPDNSLRSKAGSPSPTPAVPDDPAT